jgi:hypothetical protein
LGPTVIANDLDSASKPNEEGSLAEASQDPQPRRDLHESLAERSQCSTI